LTPTNTRRDIKNTTTMLCNKRRMMKTVMAPGLLIRWEQKKGGSWEEPTLIKRCG